MFPKRILVSTLGTLCIGSAALFANAATAGGNVGWSVSIGGPGFVVNAGQPAFAGPVGVAPWRPVGRPHFRPVVVPRPVYVRPRFAPVFVPPPVRFYAPARVVYAPPVVFAPPVAFVPGRFGY